MNPYLILYLVGVVIGFFIFVWRSVGSVSVDDFSDACIGGVVCLVFGAIWPLYVLGGIVIAISLPLGVLVLIMKRMKGV